MRTHAVMYAADFESAVSNRLIKVSPKSEYTQIVMGSAPGRAPLTLSIGRRTNGCRTLAAEKGLLVYGTQFV